jgi:hypothetical protein
VLSRFGGKWPFLWANVTKLKQDFFLKKPTIHLLCVIQASAAMLMTSALFWDITQRRVAIPYRSFRTTFRLGFLDP